MLRNSIKWLEYNTSILQSTRRPWFDYACPAPSRHFCRFFISKFPYRLQIQTAVPSRSSFPPHCFRYYCKDYFHLATSSQFIISLWRFLFIKRVSFYSCLCLISFILWKMDSTNSFSSTIDDNLTIINRASSLSVLLLHVRLVFV